MKYPYSIFLAGILSSCFACSSNKIGYINPTKILQQYHGASPRQVEFKAKAQEWQARFDSLRTEQAPAEQLAQYQAAIQQRAATEEARLNQQVLQEVNAYIKQYGREHSYHLILGATEQGNLVYAAEGADLTDDIITGLNTQYDSQHAATYR
ncbi:OmpH family outer membrane protein [Hymenobacter glacieicola]|uniref:OmpH family outer membrane protein n=1 Tax=Hymenobacter glacieicola TaxID=1562124 RepID=A0ABQ1X7G5_9BACT|nr:OmpH family outer membrane protein [Hymenobacter glacieicola]GGG59601.1 OmpH family outer membrane protein [Hymenobacter glacieicola]